MRKNNLGPKDPMEMPVSGTGSFKHTEDGNTILHEMNIQYPTASLIEKEAAAQDDITGNGKTSNVLIIGELLRQADIYIFESLHPQIITEEFEMAKTKIHEIFNCIKISKEIDREIIIDGMSLCTKVNADLANVLTETVVALILTVRKPGEPIDLFKIEIMEIKHKLETDKMLIRGLVLDHGVSYPDTKKRIEDAFILTCKVSLEYQKKKTVLIQKCRGKKLVKPERKSVEDKSKENRTEKYVVIQSICCYNQMGIDPFSLDAIAKEGIIALAKRRNMGRLILACNRMAMNVLDDLNSDCLGHAGLVYVYILVEKKFIFIEKCGNPQFVMLLIKEPNKHMITHVKNEVTDNL
ncbi:LOW QUALITY PROTEIN: T-complex protein 1 subunit zeta-like [Sarcophilus harrisii]